MVTFSKNNEFSSLHFTCVPDPSKSLELLLRPQPRTSRQPAMGRRVSFNVRLSEEPAAWGPEDKLILKRARFPLLL